MKLFFLMLALISLAVMAIAESGEIPKPYSSHDDIYPNRAKSTETKSLKTESRESPFPVLESSNVISGGISGENLRLRNEITISSDGVSRGALDDFCPDAFYSNGGPEGTGAITSQCDAVFQFITELADDFILSDDATVQGITFWIGFWSGTGDETPADLDGITIAIYNDAGGQPDGNPIDDCSHIGDMIWEQTYFPGEFIFTDDELGGWQIDVALPPISLNGDITYWLGILPHLNLDTYGQCGWKSSVNQAGSPSLLYSEFFGYYWEDPFGEDAAFCLIADPPELIGACCDDDTGICIDNTNILDCPSGNRFAVNTLCADLDPLCGDTGCDVICPEEGIPEGEPICEDGWEDHYNGGCNSEPPIFQNINPGDIICAQSGTFLFDAENRRDTDWYLLGLPDGGVINWTVEAEFDVLISVIDAGSGNCSDYITLGSGTAGPCEPVSLSIEVGSGDYWLCAGPNVFAGVECGAEYVAEVIVGPPPSGACCDNDLVCVGTMLESECAGLGGSWYIGEDCGAGYVCLDPNYCEPCFTNQSDDYITEVRFNDLHNITGPEPGGCGYGDYRDLTVPTVAIGETYDLTVSFWSSGMWTEHVSAWFDWNKNYEFEENERYYLGSGIDATLTLPIQIPEYLLEGDLIRMRVIERYSDEPLDPCESFSYGEAEDYCLRIYEYVPSYGACCNDFTGECTDDVERLDCHYTFFADESCSDILCQPADCVTQPSDLLSVVASDVDCDICPGGPIQILADNFALFDTREITRLTFRGVYYPDNIVLDEDVFTIIFRADNAGAPGAEIAGFYDIAADDRFDTGNDVNGSWDEYQYTVDFDDLDFGPGEFWIEIFNNTSGDVSDQTWAWSSAVRDSISGLQGAGYTFTLPEEPWSFYDAYEFAFDISCVGDGRYPCGHYVVGDFTGNGYFNVADVIASYSKLKTGSPEPALVCECPPGGGRSWAVAMDVTGNCFFNIADIITAYSKLKTGSPPLEYCQSCPPAPSP